MGRAFFDQVDDELRGLLGPRLRDYRCQKAGWLIKIWYGEESKLHFEAQQLSPRWGPKGKQSFEVGIHAEWPEKTRNDEAIADFTSSKGWKRKLPNAESGKAFGPRSSVWRRLSELIEAADPDDPDLAGEIAERLAAYIKCFPPREARLTGIAAEEESVSRASEGLGSDACSRGLPTEPAGWLFLLRKKHDCFSTTTSGPNTSCLG